MSVVRTRRHRALALELGASVLAIAVAVVGGAGTARSSGLSTSYPRHPLDPVTISVPGQDVEQLSVDSSDILPWPQRGMAVAAWRAFDGDHWRIEASTYYGSGRWSAPRTLSPEGVDAEWPSAALAPVTHGIFEQVAWRLATGEIQLAWKPGPRDSWRSPVTVSRSGSGSQAPVSDVTWTTDDDRGGTGRFWAWPTVYWSGRDGLHWRVHYLAYDPATGPRTTSVRLLSPAGADASSLSDNQGELERWISWSVFDGTHWQPRWSWPVFGSGPFTESPTAPLGEDALMPQVTLDGALWTSVRSGHTRLRGVAHQDWSRGLGHPVTLTASGTDASEPHILPGEQPVAVWLESDGVHTRVASSSGNFRTHTWTPTVYLTPPDGEASSLALTQGYLTWTESVSGGSRAMWSRLTATSHWTTPMQVTPSGADASSPHVLGIGLGGWNERGVASRGLAWIDQTASGSHVDVTGEDSTGPWTVMDHVAPVEYGHRVLLSWFGTDDWSPVVSSTLTEDVARWDAGTYTTREVPIGPGDRSYSAAVRPGHTYCFTATTSDLLGRVLSRRSDGETCFATPVDDHVFTRSPGWRRVSTQGTLGGSLLRSRRAGSTLRVRLGATRSVALIVAKGPGNGRIRATYRGRSVTLSLAASKARRLARVDVGSTARARAGTLVVRVVSHARPVRVDGLVSDRWPPWYGPPWWAGG